VAKTLAFVALRRTSLGPRSLNLDEERKGWRKKSGRAIAKAVSHRGGPSSMPGYVGFVVDRFPPSTWFALPILIPPTAPYSTLVRGWYNRPTNSWRYKWSQAHPTRRIKKELEIGRNRCEEAAKEARKFRN
jgi:hypothetical protein